MLDSALDPTAPQAPGVFHVLPETGEALLTAKVLSSALGISESWLWHLVKADDRFPRPVRRGERWTRFKLSEARAYIANLPEGQAKPKPGRRQSDLGVTQ